MILHDFGSSMPLLHMFLKINGIQLKVCFEGKKYTLKLASFFLLKKPSRVVSADMKPKKS